jgi:hypothetical protein
VFRSVRRRTGGHRSNLRSPLADESSWMSPPGAPLFQISVGRFCVRVNLAPEQANEAAQKKFIRTDPVAPPVAPRAIFTASAEGASATASGPVVDMPTMKDATQQHGITLAEEDISDVRWRRSMSSTRKTTQPSRAACCSLPEATAVAAAVAGAAEVAAAPAVCHGEVASCARSA